MKETLVALCLLLVFVVSCSGYLTSNEIFKHFQRRQVNKDSLEFIHQSKKLENKRGIHGDMGFRLKVGQQLKLDPHLAKKRATLTTQPEVASYSASTRYNIINVDFHPLIRDVGCHNNQVYLKVSTEHIYRLLNELTYETVLVSTMRPYQSDIVVTPESLTKEEILYKKIIEKGAQVLTTNVEGKGYGILTVFTEPVEFTSLFTYLDFYFKKFPEPYTKPSPSFTSTSNAAASAFNTTTTSSHVANNSNKRGTKWNTYLSLANVNYNYETGQVIQPVIMKTEKVGGGKGDIEVICTNCYFHMGLGIEVLLSFGWFKVSHFRASVTGDVKSNFDIVVRAHDRYDKTMDLISPFNIANLDFWVSIVPFVINFDVGLKVRFVVSATLVVDVKFSLDASHQMGVEYTYDDGLRSIDEYSRRDNTFIFTPYYKANLDVTVYAIPTLYVKFWGTIPVTLSLQPYLNALIYVNNNCGLGYSTNWGLDMSIGIDAIKIWGYTLTKGNSWGFSLVGKTPLYCSYCAQCLFPLNNKKRMKWLPSIDNKKLLLSQVETLAVSAVNVTAPTTILDCCYNRDYHPVTLDNTYSIYPYVLQVSQEDVLDGYGLLLEVVNASLIIEINNQTFHPSIYPYHLKFKDHVSTATNVTVLVNRENQLPTDLTKFLMKYYKNHLHYSTPYNMKHGTIIIDLIESGTPAPKWIYFSVICEVVLMCDLVKQDGTTLANGRLDISNLPLPLHLNFLGKGTFTMYSVYQMTSGLQLERLLNHNTTFMIEYTQVNMAGFDDKLETLYMTSSSVQIPGKSISLSASHYVVNFLPEQTLLPDSAFTITDKTEFNEAVIPQGTWFDPIHYLAIRAKGDFDQTTSIAFKLEFLACYWYNLPKPQVLNLNPSHTFMIHYMIDPSYWTNFYPADSNSTEMAMAGLFMSVKGRDNTIQVSDKKFSKFRKEGVFYEGLKTPINQFALSAFYYFDKLIQGSIYIRFDFPKKDRGNALPLTLVHEPLLHASTSVSISYLNTDKISFHNVSDDTIGLKMVGFNEAYLQNFTTISDITTKGVVVVITIDDPQFTFKEEAFQHPDDITKFILHLKGSNNISTWNNQVIPYVKKFFQSNDTHIANHLFILSAQRLAIKFPPIPFYNSPFEDVLTFWGFENYGFLFPEPKDMQATKGLTIPRFIPKVSCAFKTVISFVLVLFVVFVNLLVVC